ncbi:hypothetical protein C4D60_Mb05t06670 [Musa balbisiana]|uniref:Thaumatin-like protein n=1 Tax=Musa balbisiana TaxID=52838 RepID=A0A4S8JU77_MUSBA|nr:hypothetical protein C4D60_Mb05t06670 [Musa balbisiana]
MGAGEGSTFTFVNRCGETVWPGILSNAGTPQLESTGFELPVASSRSFQAPAGWSGRFWARTGCSSTGGTWSCATGDCGSGQVECNGAGAAPPATLAEFTLAPSSAGQDFYDVSLVDGYNLPMVVEANRRAGASGECAATGCVVDLNRMCPSELRTAQGEACRSACEALISFLLYSDITAFIQKASRDSSTSSTSTPKATGGLTLDDDSWLASLATGDATAVRRAVPRLHQSLLLVATTVACTLLLQSYNIIA